MANWISSKLKVAETFLQQIDQQAAESLGKNENPRSEEPSSENPRKSSGVVPLKDQLKKKNNNEITDQNKIGLNANLERNRDSNSKGSSFSMSNRGNMAVSVKPPIESPRGGLTDGDWTELLSVPSQPSSPAIKGRNGVSRGGGVWRDGRKKGSLGSNVSALEAKRGEKNGNGRVRGLEKTDALLGIKLKDESADGVESGVSESGPRISSVDLGSDVSSTSERIEMDEKKGSLSPLAKGKNEEHERVGILDSSYNHDFLSKDSQASPVQESTDKSRPAEMVSRTVDGPSDLGSSETKVHTNFISSVGESNGFNIRKMSFPSLNPLKKKSPSVSDDGSSSSDSGSSSSSDSESEREREERKRRRAQILAERAAAKAVEAIKERENLVARLEGEKQSLEKILEEQAKQQAVEASELQNTTMEMMDAVELEKEKHNNTRMEALARLAKLETTNADLARSLAAAQWNLEIEINRVAEVRQFIESKEAIQEELRRKISATHDAGKQVVASRGVELEHELLESEYNFVTEKIGGLQEKAKTLDMNIKMTQKETEVPTEVEVELKRRLGQLTDHLIQKQAQVESLSSEKATLAFRIEAVSRLLDEDKSMLNRVDVASTSNRDDLESGIWEFPNSKLRPMFEQRIQSGRKHFGSLVRQLDSIFCAGAVFLRRNSTARIWSVVYLVCLHLWVMYILMSHSSVSDEPRSGAVFSLENINNTGGV